MIEMRLFIHYFPVSVELNTVASASSIVISLYLSASRAARLFTMSAIIFHFLAHILFNSLMARSVPKKNIG